MHRREGSLVMFPQDYIFLVLYCVRICYIFLFCKFPRI
jgi:hypothetical protein